MKRLTLLIGVCSAVVVGSLWANTGTVQAAAYLPDHLIITRVQTASTSSATEEFVELYNPTAEPIVIAGLQVQYRSAGATGAWTTKATSDCDLGSPKCELASGEYRRFASYGQNPTLQSGMATSGGQIRILLAGEEPEASRIADMLGYGGAVAAEGRPAVAPKAGQVLQRRQEVGRETGEETGQENRPYLDTNDNAADFMVSGSEPSPDNEESLPGIPIAYMSLVITELLPNPASPAEDNTDEFIELYNPQDQAVSLRGYVLQAGNDWRYSFDLPDVVIEAGSYAVFNSAQTHLWLSNSGSQARLLDPNGAVLDETPPYATAKDGYAWIKTQQGWQWTTVPTPGAANQLLLPAVATPGIAKSPKATPKKSAAKPKSTAKKSSSSKKSAVKGAQTTASPTNTAASTAGAPAINYWVLGMAAVVVGGWALYEYRHELANKWRAWRQK